MNDIDPRESVLRSSYYTPGQVMALGRIVELSAQLETLLRQVLEQVMGLGRAAGEALFLGDRGSTLVSRIRELGKFTDMPTWFRRDAVEWAKNVDAALRDRDNLVHRAPTVLFTDENAEPEIGWARARRAHAAVPVDNDQLVELVGRLGKLQDEAIGNLWWGRWQESVGATSSESLASQ